MINILYYKGYTQYHNIGDQLINKSLLDHFRRHADVLISDDKMPEFYLESLGASKAECVTQLNQGFHKALIIDSIKSCFDNNRKVYFLASPPGHQFENSFVTGCKYIISGFFYLFLYLLGVRIIKIGFSIGPLSRMGKIGEWFRALFIKNYYVRDSISLDFVHSIGIKKASIFPDLCWSYTPKLNQKVDSENVLIDKRRKIILSFRSAVHGEVKSDSYSQSLLKLLEVLIEKFEEDFVFEIAYQVASDFEFSEQLYKHFEGRNVVHFNKQQIDLSNASYYYSGDYVLTNRLHVALLAYKFNCLPAIVTDMQQHAKINGIFSDAGIGELLIDTNQLTELALSQIEQVLHSKISIMDKFTNVEQSYRKSSDEVMKYIFSV
ncbi:polysaccharide pyruvyl transferase family protein [Sphingobacterium bambusae]|uniref:Polysaccharide pyruvyl transferase family protein n=1 Tax=Sphingobacterium bambusae TaxID=662858 RepID=A0ABW6BDV7_9SPHI|nr:polysaccharide pyruvyl transferase family protein [Sphingobacterium bambusae]WPL46883.1 polysaccharide pyruvyl transferase family protein [Sphingobacterium bambusae]